MKEEINTLKQEVKEIEQDGFALEIVKDYKKTKQKTIHNNNYTNNMLVYNRGLFSIFIK